jgi:CheY-like chemotaxis protein
MINTMNDYLVWIDDDYDLIGALLYRLQEVGYRIEKRRTYQEALDDLSLILDCRLLILDILLPLGTQGEVGVEQNNFYTGLRLLQKLQDEYGFDKPVVVCSVVTQREIIHELERRADRVLYKPEVTATSLKDEVEKLLKV